MIAATRLDDQPHRWQRQWSEAVTDPAELLDLLGLDAALLPAARRAAARFPLRVPQAFLRRMRRGDPHDPLLRQVLPLDEELAETPGFDSDPVGDLGSVTAAGVLHKYAGRALLITTGACAVHCRYCFRREFPYAGQQAGGDRWQAALAAIAADASVAEVILSGGDPLSLSNARLGELVQGIEAVGHVSRLRIHTRLPIVLPDRVDAGFAGLLASTRLSCVVVLHANHANELDSEVAAAARRIAASGATLLNQSVLLAGVNDSADALAALSEALFAARILPYYLHLLDRVRGSAHFDLPESRALALHATLRERLPGYLVPRLVREVAGERSKSPVA